MDKYGKAAIDAVNLYKSGRCKSPIEAWELATTNIFGAGTSSQKKGCPRGTFLGLCEEGLVIGVPRGKYTNSKKNKAYGINAVKVLKSNPLYSSDPTGLWYRAVSGQQKAHNSQMDVVLSLWINEMIRKDA